MFGISPESFASLPTTTRRRSGAPHLEVFERRTSRAASTFTTCSAENWGHDPRVRGRWFLRSRPRKELQGALTWVLDEEASAKRSFAAASLSCRRR